MLLQGLTLCASFISGILGHTAANYTLKSISPLVSLLHHASRFTRHTSHVTRHTSHVTHRKFIENSSRVTRHALTQVLTVACLWEPVRTPSPPPPSISHSPPPPPLHTAHRFVVRVGGRCARVQHHDDACVGLTRWGGAGLESQPSNATIGSGVSAAAAAAAATTATSCTNPLPPAAAHDWLLLRHGRGPRSRAQLHARLGRGWGRGRGRGRGRAQRVSEGRRWRLTPVC